MSDSAGEPVAAIDLPRLVAAAVAGFESPIDGPHGIAHWARVLECGLRLAARTGADPRVVQAFAVLHDCRRKPGRDPGHGHRAMSFAAELPRELLPFDHASLGLLFEAIEGHDSAEIASDVTIGTCWDADRLDRPTRGRMLQTCTGAAADPGIVGWAHARALEGHVPARVHDEWGFDMTAAAVDRLRRGTPGNG